VFFLSFGRWGDPHFPSPSPPCSNTALTRAINAGHERVAELLVARGAKTAAVNDDGLTPLIYAASTGLVGAVRLLLDRCAELLIGAGGADLTSFEGKTGDTLLMLACRHKMEAVAALLVGKGVDLDKRNTKGETALTLACAQGLSSVASVLIGLGADVTARTSEGATALSLAEASGMEGACVLLRAKGAPGAGQ
jgi:ankyrin repeat protein